MEALGCLEVFPGQEAPDLPQLLLGFVARSKLQIWLPKTLFYGWLFMSHIRLNFGDFKVVDRSAL